MNHDLKAINAAIALGDRVIPSVGCKIRYWDAVSEREYHGRVTFISNTYISMSQFQYYNVEIVTHYDGIGHMHLGSASVYSDTLLEILFIPESAPPFEEWERY